jgi:hypothetical protein
MSNIKYGLISETDARCLEKTIDEIWLDFPAEDMNITEIGIFDGQTARGIYQYVTRKAWATNEENIEIGCNYTAIDNNKDKEVLKPFPECNLIIGNSNEVYNQLEDESQHLILIDGNHSFPYIISDYYCYKNKVKIGGFLCFHDTSPQAQGKDWQRMGSEQDPDMYISVLKALKEVGLLNEWEREPNEFELTFNEFDPNDNAGGFMVFKRLV